MSFPVRILCHFLSSPFFYFPKVIVLILCCIPQTPNPKHQTTQSQNCHLVPKLYFSQCALFSNFYEFPKLSIAIFVSFCRVPFVFFLLVTTGKGREINSDKKSEKRENQRQISDSFLPTIPKTYSLSSPAVTLSLLPDFLSNLAAKLCLFSQTFPWILCQLFC